MLGAENAIEHIFNTEVQAVEIAFRGDRQIGVSTVGFKFAHAVLAKPCQEAGRTSFDQVEEADV